MAISNAMNSGQTGIYKKAGLCLAAFSLFLSPCSSAAMAGRDVAATNPANPQITLQNDRLSIKANAIPLQQLLDSIAKTCELRIMATSNINPGTIVDVDKTDWQIGKALADLLKGSNYLIVYNEASEKAGLFVSQERPGGAHGTDRLTALSASSGALNEDVKQEQKSEYIRRQVIILSERVASGASDRAYERMIKTRNPSFVKHDRELIARYENQLASLENKAR